MPDSRNVAALRLSPELLNRARGGDRAGFAQLVELYYPRALRFAQSMLGDQRDAEEAVQDTFVRVHSNLARFEGDALFDPWFFRILGNRCRSLITKRQRHHAVIEYPAVLPDFISETDHAPPDDEFIRHVHRALADLPADQREAFLLRYVNDLDYDEMTIVTGARVGTLRMRVKRALDALRIKLRVEPPVQLHDGAAHE